MTDIYITPNAHWTRARQLYAEHILDKPKALHWAYLSQEERQSWHDAAEKEAQRMVEPNDILADVPFKKTESANYTYVSSEHLPGTTATTDDEHPDTIQLTTWGWNDPPKGICFTEDSSTKSFDGLKWEYSAATSFDNVAALGQEGWELVAIQPSREHPDHPRYALPIFYLKRPAL